MLQYTKRAKLSGSMLNNYVKDGIVSEIGFIFLLRFVFEAIQNSFRI